MALDLTVLDQVFTQADLQGQAFAMRFASGPGLSYTLDIIYCAIAILAVTSLINLLTQGDGRAALAKFMTGMVPAIIVFGLVSNWSSFVTAPIKISDELVVLTTGGMAPAGLGSAVAERFAPVIRGLASSALPSQQKLPTVAAPGAPAPAQPSQTLWEKFGNFWDSGPVSSIIVGVADGLAGSAMVLVDTAIVMGAFMACWMSILAANLLIYLVLCLGPIMLALGIIPQCRSLITNFISYLLGIIFFKPVLAFFLFIGLGILDKINEIAQTTPSTTMPTTAILVFVGMLGLSLIGLILAAPSITQALFGGVAATLSPHPSSAVKMTQTTQPKPTPPTTPN